MGIISIPHSGEWVPEEFLPFLSGDLNAYREDVDFKVNELVDIGALNAAGITVIVASIHRICVDLNRAPGDSVLFWKENTHGVPLVSKTPGADFIRAMIEKYHAAYFAELQKFLAARAPFVDLHSMPSKPTAYHFKRNPNQKMERPDFCLSDRGGKTCGPEFIGEFARLLGAQHTVGINDPYLGGFITEFVGANKADKSVGNIQIEINRAIYMDEGAKKLITEKVRNLKTVLTESLSRGLKTVAS